MENNQNQIPDLNRLSILVGTILLAYSLTQFVTIPSQEIEFSILGILFPIQINFSTLALILVTCLTATGTAWLMESHPSLADVQESVVHWILPSLTSLVLLLAIEQLPFGATWWLAAGSSGLVLTLVLVSEFFVLDRSHQYFPLAEMVITMISIVLFLILAISLHAAEIRLFSRIPVLSSAALLVFLRVNHLRQGGRWAIAQGSVSFLIIGELATGFHYWPIDSIAFGIALTGPLFALIEISDRVPPPGTILNWNEFLWPLIIVLLSWVSAAILFVVSLF